MSTVLVPGALHGQTEGMSRSAQSCLESARSICSTLQVSADPASQQGMAWSNVRAHLSRRGQMMSLLGDILQCFIFSCGALADMVSGITGRFGDEQLDLGELRLQEDKLTELIRTLKAVLAQAARDEAAARNYAVSAPDAVSAAAAWELCAEAGRLYRETEEDISVSDQELAEVREKIAALEQFDAESAALFDEPLALASSLAEETALAAGSWDAASGTYLPDSGAAGRLQQLAGKAGAQLERGGMAYLALPADALAFWAGIGLEEKSIGALAAGMRSSDDRDFFRSLLEGDYETAFRADPAKLSGTSLLLVNSSFHALLDAGMVSGESRSAQEMLNGMLYTDLWHSPYGDREYHAYGQAWLDAMKKTSGSVMQTLAAAGLASEGELTDAETALLHKAASENALWGALAACACSEEMFDRTLPDSRERVFGESLFAEDGMYIGEGGQAEGVFYGSRVTDLRKEAGDRFSFSLGYKVRYLSGAAWGSDAVQYGEKEIIVPCRSEVLDDPGAMQFASFRDEIQSLRRSRDTLAQDLTQQEILAVAKSLPGIGKPVSLVSSTVKAALGTGSEAKVSAAQTLFNNLSPYIGLDEGNGAGGEIADGAWKSAERIGGVMDYTRRLHSLDAAIGKKDAQMHRYLFGSMSVYSVGDPAKPAGEGLVTGISGSGYYSPERISAINAHKQGGLAALLARSGKPPASCARVMGQIEAYYQAEGRQMPEGMENLLYGGESVMKMSGETAGTLFAQLEAAYDEAFARTGYPEGFGPDLQPVALFR